MKDFHTFKIHAPLDANETVVEMDGKRLKGVTKIEFNIAAKQMVEITLTIHGYLRAERKPTCASSSA